MKEWLASLPPIPVTTLLLYIFASAICLLLLGYLVYLAWQSWRRLDELDLRHRFDARHNFIKTTAQILGGAFFILTIVVAYLNLKATQEKNITDLFTKAIEQLGNEKSLEVRLGGIYALERIARGSPKDHWTIMEVLCSYVRWNAPWPPEKPEVAQKKRPWAKPRDKDSPQEPPETDIQAVLTVLGRTAILFAPEREMLRLDLRNTNLAGAELDKAFLFGAIFNKANLQGARLEEANLQGDLEKCNLQGATLWQANLEGSSLREANLQSADLRRANLQGARLEKANLQMADLKEANLQEASLSQANLQGADLWRDNLKGAGLYGANLQGAILIEAKLQEASLGRANLQGAVLNIANLQGAYLGEANLQGAYLDRANLQGTKLGGANLQGAERLTSDQVAKAFWDETTKWPEGFTPPAPERPPPKEGKQEKE